MSPVDIHYSSVGDEADPAVLMMGSLGSTHTMWAPQVEALSRRFRVIAYDARGHGESPVPAGPYSLDDLVDDAVALLDRLGIASAHVVGLSLGGMTAMRLAIREPARVDRLALMCTSAELGPASGWYERAAAVRAGGAEVVADAVLARWFTPSLTGSTVWEAARAMVAATPAEGYAGCCEAIAAMDLRADLGSIRAPTLVLAGADDPSTPPPHLELIAAAVPGARLQVLADAAHLANLQQPQVVNAALLAHLDPAGVTPHERGMTVRRAVLGEAHVDRSVAGTTPFTAPFQDFITRSAWGDIWSRPGLDRRTRSMLTLALLTALGQTHELGLHVRAALTNGLSQAEISEVLLHSAVYAGVPAANSAFGEAQRILDQVEKEQA